MGILKYFKKQSENQFQINSSINTVEKNNVIYTAYYKDMGDGYSSVECIITTPFNSQEHSFSIDARVPNKLIENDKPVILPVSDKGKDFVVFAFPEEQKQLSVTSYTRYQVDLKPNSIKAIPHGEKISLSNNAKLSHSSNKYHSYSKPKATELPDGDIIIAAIDSNSEGQYVTAWLLKKEQGLEFNINEGSNKVTNRLLFKVDENVESSFQFLLSNQNVGKIIYSDSTSLFSLDVTESMIDDIREGKYVNNEDEECLFAVGKERCDQFDKKISTPFLTGKDISNLSAVNTKNGAVVAFLENEQQLCLAKLTDKKGKKQIVHNYKEKIKLLQLSSTGEDDIIVSAVGEKNITQSTINSENLNVVTTRDFSTYGVKTLGDFVDIVYNNPLKLTTLFPYTVSSTPKISSSTVSVTTPLATKEITTRGSTTTIEEDTTSAATTQRTTTKPKTTKHTTVTTTASTKQPTSTERATTTAEITIQTSTAQHTTADQSTTVTTIPTTQSPKITTPAKKTTRGSTTPVGEDTTSATTTGITAQHTTTDQKTTGYTTATTTVPTTQPTTTASPKTTASTKVSIKSTTNQVTETTTSTTKPTTKPTKATAKSTARSTSRYTTSTKQDSTTIISTSSPKSTTTEMQSTTVLGFTTLAPTIVSAIMTTLGLVTQNVTNMITTDNNSMITDSSSDFNQTDVSSNHEEKSLSTAEISAAVIVPIVVVAVGTSYLIYRNCCRSNMRLPSEYTDDIGFWQRLKNCFTRADEHDEDVVYDMQLYSQGSAHSSNTTAIGEAKIDVSEEEVDNHNDLGSSKENLLNQGQSDNYEASNSASTAEKDKASVSLKLDNVEVSNGVGQSPKIKVGDSKV